MPPAGWNMNMMSSGTVISHLGLGDVDGREDERSWVPDDCGVAILALDLQANLFFKIEINFCFI